MFKKIHHVLNRPNWPYAVLLLSLAACAPVQPWQRDALAKPGMQPVPDRLEAYAKDHVYFSKEAATGGKAVGGGGCGCN